MPELIWEGKYDDSGKRPAPPQIALPFQTVETVNESAQQRQRSLDLFAGDQQVDWRNRLIWGDKKYVLPALAAEFIASVDLIYIDPPFATGADFSFPTPIPGSDDEFTKEPTLIEQKAYRDTWGKGWDSYVAWFRETVSLLHPLLSPRGLIWVHCDWHASPYIRLCMDEVFGEGHFINEIVWHYRTFQGQVQRYFARKHDTLLLYSMTGEFTFNRVFDTEFQDTIDSTRWAPFINEQHHIVGAHMPVHDSRFTRYLRAWERQHGRPPGPDDVVFEVRGQAVDSVWDIKGLDPKSREKVGYPTQKPEELLERIIATTTNPGDLVLDCFLGSGTSAVVAEKMGRRWIGCDLGRFSIHTSRKRLLSVPDVRPFVVQNLGKYERQLWQQAEFGESATSRTSAYRTFILDLYHATPVAGYAWLHGLKRGRMVHVGTVDAPVTNGDVKQIVAEFRKAVGTGKDAPSTKGIDLLGWDFAFELNEVSRQEAEKAGIDLRLVRIPREVLEKRAVEQGDIRFFELAALSVGKRQSGRKVTLTLDEFVIPLDDVPADVQKVVTHWAQWIDYWAVDWDNRDDTFHNEWQTYRTRKATDLALRTTHEYAESGDYTIVVKVIDILGNDTTKALSVKVTDRGA